MTLFTRTMSGLVAAASLAAAGAASAQTARIPYGDLDLATTAGAQTFEARVDAAARGFCRNAHRINSHLPDRSTCERAVREEAMSQLPEYAQTRYAMSRLPRVDA